METPFNIEITLVLAVIDVPALKNSPIRPSTPDPALSVPVILPLDIFFDHFLVAASS